MNAILDHGLVGVLLLTSLGYAFWSLGPRLLRARLLASIGVACQRVPGLEPMGRHFRTAAERKQPGCGSGCDGCSTTPAAGNAEVRIPVGKIGRRV